MRMRVEGLCPVRRAQKATYLCLQYGFRTEAQVLDAQVAEPCSDAQLRLLEKESYGLSLLSLFC